MGIGTSLVKSAWSDDRLVEPLAFQPHAPASSPPCSLCHRPGILRQTRAAMKAVADHFRFDTRKPITLLPNICSAPLQPFLLILRFAPIFMHSRHHSSDLSLFAAPRTLIAYSATFPHMIRFPYLGLRYTLSRHSTACPIHISNKRSDCG